jgi:hypothetical protein
VAGIDGWIGAALARLGVEGEELKAADIRIIDHGNVTASANLAGCANLSRFDTIVVDERAYFLRPDILRVGNCLIEYVRRGGNLVVQAQQPDDFGLITSRTQLAPYPIKLSRERVTVESAPVKLVDEAHALASRPNRISAADFEGWVGERAYFLPREWGAEFTALVETSDPGEDPLRGALLFARSGEGTYVYSTLALRRQMIEANAGAHRLFANLISLPKSAARTGEQK